MDAVSPLVQQFSGATIAALGDRARQPSLHNHATRRTYEMICFYFIGWADEEELLAPLTKLKNQAT